MKRILSLLTLLTLLACPASVMGQNKNYWRTSTEEVTYPKADKPLKRKKFKFTHSFERNEEGEWAYIVVEGWIDKKTIAFTCRNELVEAKAEKPDGEGWINETDINFDGVPDLMIYIGLRAYGHVASFYDAWVWNVEQARFDHVEIFSSIGEPMIDEENHCITSTGRDGPDDLVTQTFEWVDGELVLTKEVREKIEN